MINSLSLRYFFTAVLYFACASAWVVSAQVAPKDNETTNKAADETEEEPGSGIFKQIDKDGRVIFTDNPRREHADKEVELKELNTHSGKAATPKIPRWTSPEKEDKTVAYKIWLNSPQNNEQFGPAKKFIEVSTGVNPSPPHYIRTQLYWNGSPFGKPQTGRSAVIPVEGLMSRGRRSLQAELVNTRTGEVLARSEKIDVHVIRP